MKDAVRAQLLIEGINPRDAIIASKLVEGKTQVEAYMATGASKKTAASMAYKVTKSKGVRAALMHIAEELTSKQIGALAKGRLIQMIEDPGTEPRIIVQALRMGLEVGGEVGPAKELVMRHEIHVPPAAQEMIARRIFELQQKSEAIDADTGSAL